MTKLERLTVRLSLDLRRFKQLPFLIAMTAAFGCANSDPELLNLYACSASGVSKQSLSLGKEIAPDIGITSILSENILADSRTVAELGFKVFKFWPNKNDMAGEDLDKIFENSDLEVLIIMPPPQYTFRATAEQFLSKYGNLDKTVILTNWESDWVLSGGAKCFYDPLCVAPAQRISNMVNDFSKNQRDINEIKSSYPDAKLKIYYAIEVNLPIQAPRHRKVSVTHDVIPLMNPKPDFVSYSAWESINRFAQEVAAGEKDFLLALDTIAQKVGHRNLFLGEFGLSNPNVPCLRGNVLKRAVELGRQWGLKYFVYWNLYGEEFGLDEEAYGALQAK